MQLSSVGCSESKTLKIDGHSANTGKLAKQYSDTGDRRGVSDKSQSL